MTVEADQAVEPTEEVIEPSIGRMVTVSLDHILWTRQPTDLARLTFLTNDGWLERDGERVRILPSDGPGLDVGGRYVVPLVEEAGEWGVLSDSAVLPLEGDTIIIGERAARLAQQLDRRTVEDLRQELASTEPDPIAERYAELEPSERALRVAELAGTSASNSGG